MYSSARLMGGLGNQMFQIAHAYAQALEAQEKGFNVSAQFDPHVAWLENFPERQAINYCTNILQKVNFKNTETDWLEINESGFNYSKITPSWTRSIRFHGYFQSLKYFKNYTQEVKDLFKFPEDVKIHILKNFPQLECNATAIFVRRGDYLKYPEIHPPTTEEYLQQAIDVNRSVGTEHYIIISDDYAWCTQVIPKYLPKNKFTYAQLKDWEELWLASCCNNFICTNSTFGWWAAFLSDYKDKQIIFPSRWFGPKGIQNWQDIYIENSIII